MAQPVFAMNEAVVSVDGLRVGFGPHDVLDDLSLKVQKGEILGLVGGSGSGKSVLMRTIVGLLEKRAGTISLFGRDTDVMTPEERRIVRRRWGVMFQHGALFSSLTLEQNVRFMMREQLDVSEPLMREMANAKIEMVGLSRGDAGKLPAELSGGMTKRAALARALALDPEFVLLDEPTSGLDPISAAELDDLTKTLQETLGLTVFMVTHDLASLFAITDRVAVLAQGKVVAAGRAEELTDHDHPWVRSYFAGKRGKLVSRGSIRKRA